MANDAFAGFDEMSPKLVSHFAMPRVMPTHSAFTLPDDRPMLLNRVHSNLAAVLLTERLERLAQPKKLLVHRVFQADAPPLQNFVSRNRGKCSPWPLTLAMIFLSVI